MQYREALRRALRTFFQTLGGGLSSITIFKAFSKVEVLSWTLSLGLAVGAALQAAIIAFAMNVAPESP